MTEARSKRSTTSWQPGQSGNPRGRPKGSGQVAKLRASIAEQLPQVLAALLDKALTGDAGAARLLLERTIAPLKPTEEARPLAIPPGTLTEQGHAVLASVAAGELPPAHGAALLASIGHLARVAELDELLRRVEALEGKTHGNAGATT
ncbi:MAG: hypothetical protein RLZZ584_4418 [Pseudomonadota bacterium]|jgi:hypothetical protein